MNKYLKLTLLFIAVWFIASVINGFLSTLCILFLGDKPDSEEAPLSFIFSFIFSIPFVFVIWISGMISMSTIKTYDSVYRLLLYETFAVSLIGAFLFRNLFKEFNGAAAGLEISVVVSAVTTIMLFRKELKKINTN